MITKLELTLFSREDAIEIINLHCIQNRVFILATPYIRTKEKLYTNVLSSFRITVVRLKLDIDDPLNREWKDSLSFNR